MTLQPNSPMTPPTQVNIHANAYFLCDWERDSFQYVETNTAEGAPVERTTWAHLVATAVSILSVEIDRVSAHRALGSAAEPVVESAELFKVAARVMNMMQDPSGKNGNPPDPKARLYTFSVPANADITETLEVMLKLLNINASPQQFAKMPENIQKFFKPVYQ